MLKSLLLVFPTLLFAKSRLLLSANTAVADNSNSYPNQAIADLSYSKNSGVEIIKSGSNVVVDNGVVSYNIDFNLNAKGTLNALLPGGYNACTAGGMFYHLHVGECATSSVQFGTNCNSCLGHYDPWGNCGDATNNTLCNPAPGCLPLASNQGRVCNADTFAADPYRNCEVGDWSGKYGLAQVNSNGIMKGGGQSFYEVVPGDVLSKKMSVVFHCNNLQRAFCRSFADSGIPMKNKAVPSQVNVPAAIIADFSDSLGAGSSLTLTNSGNAVYELFGVINNANLEPVFADFSCIEEGNFDVSIWTTTANSFANSKSLIGSKCNDVLRAQWDINAQCESTFSNQYVNGLCSLDNNGDIAVCGSNNADVGHYECNWSNLLPVFPRYTCSPGDLSGKFGPYNIKTGLLAQFTDTTSLIPDLTDLTPTSSGLAKAVAIHCPIKDTASPKDDVEFLVCAEWSASQ